jgi:hypothetical protein
MLSGSGRAFAVEMAAEKGHRLGCRPREWSINQLLTAESKLLLCSWAEEMRECARFQVICRETKVADWLAEQSGFELSAQFLVCQTMAN